MVAVRHLSIFLSNKPENSPGCITSAIAFLWHRKFYFAKRKHPLEVSYVIETVH